MKSRANGWLLAIAALFVAAVLFLPVPTREVWLALPKGLKPLSAAPILAWFVAVAGFWAFRVRFWPNDQAERRRFRNFALLLVLQAVLIRIVLELAVAYRVLATFWLPKDAWVWVPWFLIPGLAGMLLGARFGVLVSLAGALMLYLIGNPGPLPLMGCIVSPLVGILCLRRSPTRTRVLRAGTGAGITLGIVAAGYLGLRESSAPAISAAALLPLVISFLGSFVLLAVLPVLEWILGELSDVTLIEYGTDHRLLDQLRTKAPGTWCHSLNVADLAEKAAAEIGARALFCKTAALYHDIGKLKEPAVFAENNADPALHEQLEPHVSAQKIIEHVTYGVELARKNGLPRAFREIIAEHHGTSVVRFFYAKACQPLPDGSQPRVDRSLFCYPGPPPSSRESGIIALADVVEAASRSFSSRAEPELRGFVQKLLSDRISEGELAECPLTLSDLAKIEATFVQWLRGRNHFRPAYPGMADDTTTIRLTQRAETQNARMPA